MKRIFGLDLLRSIAILLVLSAHIAPFFKNNKIVFNWLYHAGLYGVEIFFVLTGYLVGKIIVNSFFPNATLGKSIKFYTKRLLRIIPLYYSVLIFTVLASYLFYKDKSLHLFHFLFVQNFSTQEIAFFPVSWTISVQFWFYLTLPLLFILLSKIKKIKNVLLVLIGLIILINFVKIAFTYLQNPTFDYGTRKNIFFRQDSLLIGSVFAFMKIKYKKIFYFFTLKKIFFVTIFTLLIYYFVYIYFMINQNISFFDKSIFYRTIGWPILSIMLTIILINFESSNLINKTLKKNILINNFFTSLSKYSFAIFLIHYDIYNYFDNHLSSLNKGLSIFMSTFIILTLSFFLYSYIEEPFLLKKSTIKIKT